MRLLVCGGRDFSDKRKLWTRLDEIDLEHCIDCIIEGEASGTDRLSREWAQARGVPFYPFPAHWDDLSQPDAVIKRTKTGKLYDARAGSRRNTEMLEVGQPTHILPTPGGTGTADMVRQAKAAGVTPLEF